MEKKDITLIHFLPNANKRPCVPLSCVYLIDALKKNNFKFEFRDFQLVEQKKAFSFKNIISFFNNPADIIAISCFSHALPYVIKVAQKIKQESPKKTIILGGVGPSLAAKAILDNFPFIDVIAVGDGENTLPELLNVIQKNKKALDSVKGIAYRKDSATIFTPKRETSLMQANNLIPAFKNIYLKPYKKISILFAEGCPYRCPFCCVPRFHTEYKRRSLRLIKEEILYLSKQKNGPKEFGIQDEGFLSDKHRVYKFLKFIGQKKNKDKISFSCYGRINLMDRKIIKDLSNNNINTIYYGIESGSNNVLNKINKGFTIEQAVEVLLCSKKYFKNVKASFIFGYPFENKSDFLSTIMYYKYLDSKKITTQLHLLCPLPRTELYELYKRDLFFSERIISDMSLSLMGIKNIKDLIIKFPHVFPTFYHFKSPSLEYKLDIAKKLFGISY